MNQSEVKHVLDTTPVETPKEKELVFTKIICRWTGESDSYPFYQPSDYINIKHLTGNLYYAYDNYCDNGVVYVGEFK